MKYKIIALSILIIISGFILTTKLVGRPKIKGQLKIELYEEKAPQTVANFKQYVSNGFYNNTIFHRVIPGFVVQGGGFTDEMEQKTTQPPIKNEADNGVKNSVGTLSMARTQIVDSATSQFFINLVDNKMLDHTAKTPQGYGYCVFAKISDGMEIVNEIAKVKTSTSGYHRDVPVNPVYIKKAELLEDGKTVIFHVEEK
jgi:peptidyl-prolyl cis-trans isomerase B (cyclophilin B)